MPSPQAPTGTRDLYPLELARRRWIESRWRRAATRHGFDEIDGPTFEHTDLYTRKSGEGIVGEIFGVYSGKDEAGLKDMGARLAAGERGAVAPYALRPEFTPTLARLYAARAAQLPKPCRWSWQGPCFRAERPQRGRLREFWQWNCDVLGTTAQDEAQADAEVIACVVDLLRDCGLSPAHVRVRINDRRHVAQALRHAAPAGDEAALLSLLDKRSKMKAEAFAPLAAAAGLDLPTFDQRAGADHARPIAQAPAFAALAAPLAQAGVADWCVVDASIVRGLAYYTGMVFEVIAQGERAIAGGGRYDRLIETFAGPPTPAVGFGMGDVVLSLVLQDQGLMPSDRQIARDLCLRPDVFVIANEDPASQELLGPLLARLRAGGLHARRSYKSTKNIGKLLKDASDADARFALIIEDAREVTLKNLDDNTQRRGPRDELLTHLKPA